MSNINISVTEQDPINVSIAAPEVQNVDVTGQSISASVSDGDKGDIVVTGNGSIWTLDPNALATRVPYTGATADVNLGEFGLLTGNIEFDTSPTNAPTGAGSMVWNDTEGTLDMMLKGGSVNLPIGQKQVVRAVNGTGGNLTRAAYRAVKITGAQGQRLQVSLARADNDANSKDTIGLVAEDISNNQEGFIVTSGTIASINTTGSLQGETWNDGDTLYLSGATSGVITNVKPSAPTHTVILGFVIYAHQNNGKIYVKVDNGYELDELHNVNAPTPVSGEYLRYNGTVWVDSTIQAADLPTGIDAAKIGTGVVSNTEFSYLDGVTSAIQTQLNGKQATLTNPVTGTGTTNYIAKFTGTSAVGDSQIFDNGTNVSIGATNASVEKLYVRNNAASYTTIAVDNQNPGAAGTGSQFGLYNGGSLVAWLRSLRDGTGHADIGFANAFRFIGQSTGTPTEYARFSSAGNVSIGNTNNTYKLDISGTLRNTTSAYFATSSGSVGIGTTSPTNKLMVIAGNSSGFNLSYDASGNNRTGIFAWTNGSSSGGIGGGVEQTSDSVFTARSTSASYVSFGSGNIRFQADSSLTSGNTYTPTTRLLINAGGNVSIGNTNNTYNLDISGTLRNTTDAYFATSSGNVGIGNTSTSYKLDVTGTIRSTSTLLWGTSGGTYEYAGGATHIRGYSNSTLNLDYSGGSSGWGINNQADTSRLLSVNDIGCLGLGIATFEASVTRAVYIATGVSPAASATDGFVMYSADITAGNAAAHFRTEGGAIIKLYQQTTGVAAATFAANSGTAVNDASTFDGYTLNQIVKALRNNGLLA
jgi:hypothetical protein